MKMIIDNSCLTSYPSSAFQLFNITLTTFLHSWQVIIAHQNKFANHG